MIRLRRRCRYCRRETLLRTRVTCPACGRAFSRRLEFGIDRPEYEALAPGWRPLDEIEAERDAAYRASLRQTVGTASRYVRAR